MILPLILSLTALAAALYFQTNAAADPRHSTHGSVSKTLSTALLAAALLAAAPAHPGIWIIILGLALGSVGDFALSRPGTPAFLVGTVAFALGHAAYAYGFWSRSADFGPPAFGTGQITALIALSLFLLSTEFWLAPRTGPLRWPLRGYVLCIGIMATAAILLAPAHGQLVLMLGAGLFVFSDILLAVGLFLVSSAQTRARLSLVLWPAYWLGQALIAFGAVMYWHPKA